MVNSVNSGKPKYENTLYGAAVCAAAGAVGTASLYTCYNGPKTLVRSVKKFSEKKNFIKMFQEGFSRFSDVDFSKNTVSRFCKEVQGSIRKPAVISGILTMSAGIGAVMGFAVDCVKNLKAKKE